VPVPGTSVEFALITLAGARCKDRGADSRAYRAAHLVGVPGGTPARGRSLATAHGATAYKR
jgi:hypothetical protein